MTQTKATMSVLDKEHIQIVASDIEVEGVGLLQSVDHPCSHRLPSGIASSAFKLVSHSISPVSNVSTAVALAPDKRLLVVGNGGRATVSIYQANGIVCQVEWQFVTDLNGISGSQFGHAIAINQRYDIAVGAPYDLVSGSGRVGKVHLFVLDTSQLELSWVLKQILVPSLTAHLFGYSVAFDASATVYVSQNTSRLGHGLVVYQETNGNWAPTINVSTQADAIATLFNGDVVVTGDTSANQLGAVLLYVWTQDTSYSLVATLLPNNTSASSEFGAAIAINDQATIAIGAFRDGTYGAEAGAVYVYDRVGDMAWSQGTAVAADKMKAGDHFGRSVALHGRYMAVGAPGALESGAVYLFKQLNRGRWEQTAVLTVATATLGLGRTLAMSDSMVIASSEAVANETEVYTFGFGAYDG
jgi:hypothetical protein